MTIPKNIPLTIYQGATFRKKVNWYGGGKVLREIDSVATGCPSRIEVTAHGLPASADTPVYIQGVSGARNLNTDGKEVVATYVDADHFDVPLDTLGDTYTSGTGCIHYFAPKALTGWIARMDIREDIDDTTTLVSLTSAGGDIVITLATAEIEIVIADDVTKAFEFDSAVYDLELEDPSGNVTRLIEGKATFVKEVTRS